MFGLDFAALGLKAAGLAKSVFTSKWFYVGLAALALAGGTYFTLNHWKNQAVTSAVSGANSTATVKTLQTGAAITNAIVPIDQKMDAKKLQTTKDYTNARATVQSAPTSDRDAQAAPLLIDTINGLDRLRANRDADSVSNDSVPVG